MQTMQKAMRDEKDKHKNSQLWLSVISAVVLFVLSTILLARFFNIVAWDTDFKDKVGEATDDIFVYDVYVWNC